MRIKRSSFASSNRRIMYRYSAPLSLTVSVEASSISVYVSVVPVGYVNLTGLLRLSSRGASRPIDVASVPLNTVRPPLVRHRFLELLDGRLQLLLRLRGDLLLLLDVLEDVRMV